MKGLRRILVIEDDADIASMLELNLRSEGFDVVLANSGEAGLQLLQTQRFDLLVLDLTLPGIDGLAVCREVRTLEDYLPIIIVSARSSEAHRIRGLDLGADDYVAKPFSTGELVARAHAVLRRMQAATQRASSLAGVVRHGDLTIDPVARTVYLAGRELVLTFKEFDLLMFFARHPGQVFRRLELLDRVWGYSHEGYEHTVNAHINRLRAKIEANPAQPGWILTVWGVGYKFVEGDPNP